ncbi:hypothetical protein ACU4GA_22280 [Methylobacterium oryzae CBMB20]
MSASGPSGLIPAILAGLTLRGSGLLNGRPPRPAANSQRDPNDPGHETRDVNVRNTVLVMAGLALTALAVVGTMVWLMGTFAASQRRALPALTPQQTTRLAPPPPNLQADRFRRSRPPAGRDRGASLRLRLPGRVPHPRPHPDRARHGPDRRPLPRTGGARCAMTSSHDSLQLWPAAVSATASETDLLILAFTVLTLLLTVPVFVAITTFALRYREGSEADRSPSGIRSNLIEISWMLIPFLLTLIFFVWGARLFIQSKNPPPTPWWSRRSGGSGCGSSSTRPVSPRSTTCTCRSASRSACTSSART